MGITITLLRSSQWDGMVSAAGLSIYHIFFSFVLLRRLRGGGSLDCASSGRRGSYSRYSCAAVMTTLLTFDINSMPVRFPLLGYIYEVHHNYSTPYDTAIGYLKTHAKKDDIVYTSPDNILLVLHFYLADSLIMASLLTKESTLPVEKLRKAGYPAYIDEYYPNWIVCFGMYQDRAVKLDYFSRGPYAYQLDKNIAVFYNDMTRPELPWHSLS